LRKLIPGATDKSYGIHVAQLAGIPKKVTDRAEAVLTDTLNRTSGPAQKVQRYTQLLIADDSTRAPVPVTHPVIDEIRGLSPDTMTPLQALQKLHELKDRLKDGDKPA
jgi:DNA mismatch repair protein MutS